MIKAVPRRMLVVAALVGIATLAAALLVVRQWSMSESWSDDPGSIERLDSMRFTMHPGDGSHGQRWMSADELYEKYPVPIELPQTMPPGYSLLFINFYEAGSQGNPSGADILLGRYGPTGGDAVLFFSQLVSDGLEEIEHAETISVHGVDGQYFVQPDPAGLNWRWLAWARCGRQFELHVPVVSSVSRADLVRIAESVGPEAC